jgi:CarD family transcriptional regulator
MRSAKKTVKPSKAESANTTLRRVKQTQIRKAGAKVVKTAVKTTQAKADAAAKRKSSALAAQAAPSTSAGARSSARPRNAAATDKSSTAVKVVASANTSASAKTSSATKNSSAAKSSSAVKTSTPARISAATKASTAPKASIVTRIINAAKSSVSAKSSPAAKAAARAGSPAPRQVSDIGATVESVAAAIKTSRPAAAAKRSKSGAIKREAADGSVGNPATASPDVAAPIRPAAKKQPADSALVQAVSVSTPEVIDLRSSKRQAIGDAAAPAASTNSIPTEEEQKRVTKKIEKKTTAESPAIARRGSDSAVAEAIVSARAAAVREAAPSFVEPVQSEAKPGDKATVAIAKPVKSSTAPRQGFKPNDFIVYPAHGVGQIVAIEEQEVAGFTLELYVIIFVKDKMILKVPTPKVASVGMRKLAEADVVRKALDTLTGRARIKRTMWSRRAQEYEAKINSGDLISIAEVVRDLYRSDAQPEQSYSERQLYEAALDRMAREVVIVQKLTETETLKAIEAQLQKGPRRGKAEEIEVDDVDADIEEAA